MAFPHDLDPRFPGLWDREKLAFALWVAHLIAEADGNVVLSELLLIERLFPRDVLMSYAILDADGEVTPVWKEARDHAIRQFPHQLTTEEKLDLVTVFHDVCLADQRMVQAELLVLREAAEALGLTVSQLSAHLRDRT